MSLSLETPQSLPLEPSQSSKSKPRSGRWRYCSEGNEKRLVGSMSLLFAFDTTQETQSDHSIKSEQSLSRIVFYSAISSFTLILSWSTFMSSSFSPIGLLAATLLPSGFILLILSKLSGDKKTQFPSRKEIPSILADGFFYFVSIFSTLSALAIESPTRILILGMICPKIVEFILAFLGRLSHLPLFKHFIKSSVKTKSTFRFNSILGYFVLVVAFLHLCFDTTWSTFGSQNSAFFPFSAAIWMLVASFFSLLRSKSIRTITSKDLGVSLVCSFKFIVTDVFSH